MVLRCLPRLSVYALREDKGIHLEKETLMMVDKDHFVYPQGTLLVLAQDDNTPSPEFRPCGAPNNVYEYVNMERLTIFDPTDPDHIALATKAKLKGKKYEPKDSDGN